MVKCYKSGENWREFLTFSLDRKKQIKGLQSESGKIEA
mgnify:CR=1 FL=1